MYPSAAAPAFGTFVAELEQALAGRGHVFEHAVVTRSADRARHLALARDVALRARRFRPEVVYAHFLVPAGLLGVLGGRAPAVVTAHGQDVENARRSAIVRAATRLTVQRAASVVAVSRWLRDRLVESAPEARDKTSVVDCGVDLERFAPSRRDEARRAVGWRANGTRFLCVGSLTERKNVLRLARAVAAHDDGELAFVGDGPLRPALEGRPRVRLVGPVPHGEIPRWIAAADVVCQPSLVEPFGLATLEGLAGGRAVVSTRVGGPPEFVPPGAGVLVDPLDDAGLAAGLAEAAALPRPNRAARAAAEAHDVRLQAERVEELLLQAARGRRA